VRELLTTAWAVVWRSQACSLAAGAAALLFVSADRWHLSFHAADAIVGVASTVGTLLGLVWAWRWCR
jgi:hypothetical protein